MNECDVIDILGQYNLKPVNITPVQNSAYIPWSETSLLTARSWFIPINNYVSISVNASPYLTPLMVGHLTLHISHEFNAPVLSNYAIDGRVSQLIDGNDNGGFWHLFNHQLFSFTDSNPTEEFPGVFEFQNPYPMIGNFIRFNLQVTAGNLDLNFSMVFNGFRCDFQ